MTLNDWRGDDNLDNGCTGDDLVTDVLLHAFIHLSIHTIME